MRDLREQLRGIWVKQVSVSIRHYPVHKQSEIDDTGAHAIGVSHLPVENHIVTKGDDLMDLLPPRHIAPIIQSRRATKSIHILPRGCLSST